MERRELKSAASATAPEEPGLIPVAHGPQVGVARQTKRGLKRKRGGQPKYDPTKDQKIADVARRMSVRDAAKDLGITEKEVRQAKDRHRKRKTRGS